MKKQLILIFTATFLFCLPIKSPAQDTLHIKIGFFFNPQGYINLQEIEKGFSTITPVFFVTSFAKGKGGVNVMYNMTFNNIQGVYFHKLYRSVGTYLCVNKSVLTEGGYTSIGLTRSLAEGRATGFFEFGSNWNNWTPAIYTGVIIPFTIKVK